MGATDAGRQPARERSAADIDWGALMPEVAQILFGDPPRKSGGQWRYGRKGSLAVHVSGSRAGQWYSFEDDEGGGVLALIEFRAGLSPDANHRAAFDWLRERGLIPAEPPAKTQRAADPDPPPFEAEEAPDNRRSTSTDEKNREGRIRASRLWSAARPADEGTLAHTYLVGRMAWPPSEPPLPGAVRWIDRKNWPKGVWPTPPKCAGAILYGYTVVGTESRKPLAVNAEALDAHGKRLRSERWRKCIGSRQGLAFALPGRGFDGPIIVCEGEVDALACFWMRPGAHLIMASGGSGGLAALAPGLVKMTRRAGGPTVEIEPDGDSAGFKGVAELIRALALESVRAHAHPLRIGGDPAADLRARIKARLARTNLADAWARELNLAE